MVEKSACQCRRCKSYDFAPWVGKIPWRRKWKLTPVFLLGKFHGQRSLVGYSPWGYKELDTTGAHTHTILQECYQANAGRTSTDELLLEDWLQHKWATVTFSLYDYVTKRLVDWITLMNYIISAMKTREQRSSCSSKPISWIYFHSMIFENLW